MRAVVLVGGFGTRLRPLTLTTPKPMLPVGHRPMLEHVVGRLRDHGVTEAVLALGFKPEPFTVGFPDGTCGGVALRYAVEPEPLDTAGAVAFAARAAGIDDTFLVVNGDVLTDGDVSALVATHRRTGAEATIALTEVEDPSAFGVVPTDPDGRVLAFIEKPPRESAPTNLVNAGTYVLEPSVLDRIEPGRKVSIERVTFPAMVEEGRLFALHLPGYWLDTGRPDQYLQANLDVLDGRRLGGERCAAAGEGAVLDGSIHHSVVEAGVCVEAGASITDSLVLSGAAVARDASVRRSIVGPRARIGAGAVLDEAVIGADVVIEAGASVVGARVPEPV